MVAGDALALEAQGLVVERTDITPRFVELLREQGYAARVLDPLTGEIGVDDAYDGVWAQACLLHLDRADLPVVLARLAAAARPGAALYLSLKEGDGEGWSTHGKVPVPRRFTYWRAEPLRQVIAANGWTIRDLHRKPGSRGETWLEVLASRGPALVQR